MPEDKNVVAHDLLGIAPIGRAVERVTDSVLSGAEALLARVCLPGAEEFGLLSGKPGSVFFTHSMTAWMASLPAW